ncbi:acyl-CoA thioesterase [Inmirania thermothiophila]|uniref:Acyl-CoA thioester hydrolase n=1 Tax=Inmirania thermothiophila TaxID=1750597 RepID=A0A3N1Y0U0_9GAMM|nr:thioesterase family protein [Inmirania thermothiophila]ROR32454.1 acyl-CoA thioester hydrolase [Inmirania thermothiophila]
MTHRRLVHRTRMPIRWGDMDALGHVNNAAYFRYFEQARVEWLERTGLGLVQDGVGAVIVNASCTYHRALVYPGEIEVAVYAGPPGRSSFETWYALHRTDAPEVLCAEGQARVVWVDHRAGRSVPLPEALRALLPAPAPDGVPASS